MKAHSFSESVTIPVTPLRHRNGLGNAPIALKMRRISRGLGQCYAGVREMHPHVRARYVEKTIFSVTV